MSLCPIEKCADKRQRSEVALAESTPRQIRGEPCCEDTELSTSVCARLQLWARANYERVVIVKRLVQEINLAWALAEAARPQLSAVERDDIFVAIGAGDTFGAIRQLFKSVAIKRIPLRPDLVQRCTTWLHAYVGHEDERYLRRLIDDFLIPYAIQVPAPLRVNRLPITPTPGQRVALTSHRDKLIRQIAWSKQRSP